ncbi:M3 family metallopeptidase [Weeksellaceae bacterium TAE3-ERU29]|nr:M3 family metallopeptidase [Weeksellaceae bacterium TAE3-ERU29]
MKKYLKKIALIAVLGGLVLNTSCDKKIDNMTEGTTDVANNPLLNKSDLPFGAPDFSKIKDSDFKPALEEAMRLQNNRINEIVESREEPTFENTIVALQNSGRELDFVSNVFGGLAGADTNETIKKLQEEMAPIMAAHSDEIYLNDKLFAKVKKVYDNRADLQGEDLKLVEEYYNDFTHAGAALDNESKEKLKKLNKELASLQNEFNQKLLNVVNNRKLLITNKQDLDGLSEEQIKTLEKGDGSGWEITLLNTTQQPLMSSLKNREIRKKLFELSWNRTNGNEFNTNDIIIEIAKKRAKKVKILGFDNYTDWSLNSTMVGDVATIKSFFSGITPDLRKKGRVEAEDIKAMMAKDGIKNDLQPWDWEYYAEKVRKEKYDLNEDEIKPYFNAYEVLENGVFYAANKLYGLQFKRNKDIPAYHPDVRVYEVLEEDGTPFALFYADYFARDSKRGGAWMSNFVTQSKEWGQKPVIYNVCNFTKPVGNAPALISFDEVTTIFHEFGHALHGLFADQKYAKLSGTSVARDFVEYPSQANEHWALNNEVLKNYAKHYKTGEVIPDSLIIKIKNASTFNQGFGLTEVLAAADLDLNWHNKNLKEINDIKDPNVFEKESLEKDNLWDPYIPPRYRSSYFAHIFGGGYASGYYAYLWTEMLAHDTGAWFDENGGLNRANGQRYRDMILSKGNTIDYKKAYKDFTGRDPQVKHMLKARGLN